MSFSKSGEPPKTGREVAKRPRTVRVCFGEFKARKSWMKNLIKIATSWETENFRFTETILEDFCLILQVRETVLAPDTTGKIRSVTETEEDENAPDGNEEG